MNSFQAYFKIVDLPPNSPIIARWQGKSHSQASSLKANKTFDLYGAAWDRSLDSLEIELECIRRGGRWQFPSGQWAGIGLFQHYKNAQSLLWREDDHHRWSDLGLRSILDNDICVFMGPGDSGKTEVMAKWALVDWWASPNDGLFLVSSTDVRGFELRIWGRLKGLFNRARENYPYLPGKVLESMHSITPSEIGREGETGRLLDRGLICIPCLQGTRYVGLGKYVGIKPPKDGRMRYIGDELQFMGAGHLKAFANWIGKRDFKSALSGNPLDPYDPLGQAAEPPEGWTAMPVPDKTATWRSRFFDAFVVNYVGSDSPNFDYPATEPVKYHYLVGHKKLKYVAKTYGKDSVEWCSQCEGIMVPGLVGKRVITRELCRIHHAHDEATWAGTARTKVFACDPAYGGGDRCVAIWGEFGESSEGKQIICLHEPEIIPVSVKLDKLPEDQIAEYVQSKLETLGIPVENAFYDSFGKGTLGFAFAKLFGHSTPIPVDSGARPTKRPVRYDLFVDEEDGNKRLKRCDEHYSKFVTEMWFSVAETIHGEQMRELPMEVMLEGCMREYMMVLGNKYEVEPKADTKDRMGRSPDLFDAAAILVEGARRLGFKIQRLGVAQEEASEDGWLERDAEEWQETIQSKLLTHV
jgi:hypothetical protein